MEASCRRAFVENVNPPWTNGFPHSMKVASIRHSCILDVGLYYYSPPLGKNFDCHQSSSVLCFSNENKLSEMVYWRGNYRVLKVFPYFCNTDGGNQNLDLHEYFDTHFDLVHNHYYGIFLIWMNSAYRKLAQLEFLLNRDFPAIPGVFYSSQPTYVSCVC